MSCIQSKEIYSKALFLVLALVLLIFTASPVSPQEEQKGSSDKKVEEQGESIYEPGAALLEIFKTDSIDKVSDLVPVIRTLWKHDLACTWSGKSWEQKENPWYIGGTVVPSMNYTFLVPERYAEVGLNNPYIARFSFYYEAKEPGKYGFTVWHARNTCRLIIGSSVILEDSSTPSDITNPQSTTQGVCKLEKGFHRVEFWLISSIDAFKNDAYFAIKVLTPDGFDAAPITKDMLLMKPAKSSRL